ncbi:MAG TPA: sigma factor [Bauldia sp.]|nr:sigma factor [Bauldia sp.]
MTETFRSAQSDAAEPPPATDARALRTLMAAAAYHARRVARTMRLGPDDREDAEQEILLALLERRRFFDPARGAWSAFADRVARQAAQTVADGIGAERMVRGPSLDQPVDGSADDGPTLGGLLAERISVDSSSDEGAALSVALRRFLRNLPDELRLVAALALDEDGDLAETQRRSGLSTSEFYRRLREVRLRLVCTGLVSWRPAKGAPV